MLPSLTTYSAADIRQMSASDKARFSHELAELRWYVDLLGEGANASEALRFARWVRSIDRPMRSLPLPRYLAYQEMALRADRALGLTIENLRLTGQLTRGGRHGPTLADFGVEENQVPRFARFLSALDHETFESAIKAGRTARNLSGAHVKRILNGQSGDPHTERVVTVMRLAAEGLSSHEIAKAVGFRDGYNVRQLAKRNDIDLPGDRTAEAQLKSRATTRSTSGFSERNYKGLVNALSALDHVLSDSEGQLHPDVTPDQATAWAKELRRGRAQLSRLISTLKEAATP